MSKKKIDESSLLIENITEALFEKGGENVLKLDMKGIENPVCDYFIICHARSSTQVDALAEAVITRARNEAGERPFHKEGLENCFWVLLDYGSVIVHIFMEEYRKFYNLEGLWADAEVENIVDGKIVK